LSALGSLHPGTCAVAVASSDATLIMDLNIVHLRTARHGRVSVTQGTHARAFESVGRVTFT